MTDEQRMRIRSCAVCKNEFDKDEVLWTKDCHGIPFRQVCFKCYEKVMSRGFDGEYYTAADECLDDDF